MGVRATRSMRAAVVGIAAIFAAAGGSSAQAAGPISPVFRLGPDILDTTRAPQPTPVQISALAGIDIVQVSASDDHILALSSGGSVYAWGQNFAGQLGNGTTTVQEAAPVQVLLPAGVGKVVQVAAGEGLSVAVTSTGRVLTWGAFPGDGTTTAHLTPTAIALPHNERARSISANADFVEYVTRGGAIWGWGVNEVGELGNGHVGSPTRPVRAHLPAHFVARSVATGLQHSLALGTDTRTGQSEVLAWGSNYYGQLGDPSVQSLVPVMMPIPAGAATITSIAAGGLASGAIDARGTAYSWGATNGIARQRVPTVVALPVGVRATAMSPGDVLALVTTSSNQLYGWGQNFNGALGSDLGMTYSMPTDVAVPAGTIAATAHNSVTTYVILRRP